MAARSRSSLKGHVPGDMNGYLILGIPTKPVRNSESELVTPLRKVGCPGLMTNGDQPVAI